MAPTMPRAIGLCLVLCLMGLSHVAAQANRENRRFRWPVNEYPNPRIADQGCGRNRNSSVCDPNGLIRPTQADEIDDLIDKVYRNTTADCLGRINHRGGYQIRVAIMPRMQRIFPNGRNTSRARLRDAMMYAYMLSERWQFHGDCNETVLILFSKHDDILFTLTRQTARAKLSDNDVTTVSIAVRHYFDDDETIADGLMEMIRRYRDTLNKSSPHHYRGS